MTKNNSNQINLIRTSKILLFETLIINYKNIKYQIRAAKRQILHLFFYKIKILLLKFFKKNNFMINVYDAKCKIFLREESSSYTLIYWKRPLIVIFIQFILILCIFLWHIYSLYLYDTICELWEDSNLLKKL